MNINIVRVTGTRWLCVWSPDQNKWVPVIKLTKEQIVEWRNAEEGFFP